MKGMIFCAGLGTRLKPLTDTMPKALVPLAGKPLLQWQVEKLRDAGITDIIVNVHHFPDQIIDTIRVNNGWGCNMMVSDERDCLLDTGGGLKKIKNEKLKIKNEPVLACNVDILSNIDIRALMAYWDSLNTPNTPNTPKGVLVVSERTTQRYLCFDEQDRLCGWTNSKTGELKGQDGRHLAFSGMQILGPEVLARLGQMKEEKFSLIDFYLSLVHTPYTIHHTPCLKAFVPMDYRMMDVGKIDQIEEAERFAESL